MNTQENNKLIAEFMGIAPNEAGVYHVSKHKGYSLENLLYHTSWDWLMPVVEKINTMEDYRYSVSINYHYTSITNNIVTEIIVDEDTDTDTISGCYKAVVEFINQYNK